MKKDIPRLVPIWLIISILIIFITQCGCITKRGHGLGGGYIKGEDGVYRKPKSSQTIQPAKPSESKQVPLKSTYEPPNTEIIKKHSVFLAFDLKSVKTHCAFLTFDLKSLKNIVFS